MQLRRLVHIDVEGLKELIGNPRPVDEVSEGLGCDCETARNGNTYIDHLTEACAFATDNGKIFLADILQPYNSIHQITRPILQASYAHISLMTLYEAFT
jgi:hypothetical protein